MVCRDSICGGYQFLGKNITPDGTELEGLGILDFILNQDKPINGRYCYRK